MDEQIEKNSEQPNAEQNPTFWQRLKYPILSVIMDAACPACIGLVYLSSLFMWWEYLSLLFIGIFMIGAFITPFAGILLGIMSLSMHKTVGKTGIALGIIAIALPVIASIVIATLFSTGVMVIRFM